MPVSQPLTTYLELRASNEQGEEGAGLSHKAGGLVLLHVVELAAHGEPRGGITLVHDAGDHGGRYLDTARRLAEADLAVALPDLRGHGRSEGERGHSAGLPEVLRDLGAVQEHLSYRLPVAPKALVGIGLGALYALHYAAANPTALAGLVLLSPRWNPRFEAPKKGGLFKAFKKVASTDPLPLGVDPTALSRDPAATSAWTSDNLVHDIISVRAAEQARECARAATDNLARTGCDVLILHGTSDRIASCEDSSARAGGRVEVELVEGGFHDLLHDSQAATTTARVRDWILARL